MDLLASSFTARRVAKNGIFSRVSATFQGGYKTKQLNVKGKRLTWKLFEGMEYMPAFFADRFQQGKKGFLPGIHEKILLPGRPYLKIQYICGYLPTTLQKHQQVLTKHQLSCLQRTTPPPFLAVSCKVQHPPGVPDKHNKTIQPTKYKQLTN